MNHQRPIRLTGGHELSVSVYARAILKQLHLYEGLGPAVEQAIRYHDIGTQFVPEAVLSKAGRLTAEEFVLVQGHSALGERMVRSAHESEKVAAIVRSHHERMDGGGYPDGLRGPQIPLASRIIAVADTFDALTSPRPYRPAHSWDEALDELEWEAGAQLDPFCVAALRVSLDDLADVLIMASKPLKASMPQ